TGAPGRSILKVESRNFEAILVGFDSETDLAVLKIKAENLPALKLGDSDDLRQGELVLAFGSPLGLENSVSLGVVSSVARQLRPEDPMIYIQTDAPINPGNSGGPLVNTKGEVVGINTLIFSQSGGNEGIGFSAPSNIVRAVYNQIVANGRVRRGEIGVFAQTITPGLATGLGLKKDWGVILADVYPGQPAYEAGLRVGDIILSLDSKIMENGRQFDVNLYQRSVGDVIKIEALRGDSSLKFWVHIIERPADENRLVKLSKPSDHLVSKLGVLCVTLDDIISERLPKLRRQRGVVVVSRVVRSVSKKSRLLAGDVIYSVNRSAVYDIDDLQEILSGFESGDRVIIQVERSRGLRYLSIEIE
ncbi:MAG: trypsin-like peptidase domain-containing protein, partial [candidate division Zixibacteria bacterium]|nr:trypsin-like peptidase domain-containing protein [candidate division Zixibacteria bacterium]